MSKDKNYKLLLKKAEANLLAFKSDTLTKAIKWYYLLEKSGINSKQIVKEEIAEFIAELEGEVYFNEIE